MSEEEIIRYWGDQKTHVSICCTTYNHEAYVQDALDGFLNQKTEFPFEIIVHDDASSDNTKKILLEYKVKYPTIIKLILQDVNQYSLGKRVLPIAFKQAVGEYVAICEGDDYWIDNAKLQYQITCMKNYPAIDLSFHPSRIVSGEAITHSITGKRANKDKIIPLSDVIQNGGVFCPTQSIVIKRNVACELPEFFYRAPIGDYFIQVLGSANGGALYINKVMSAYRINIGESWTTNIWNNSKRKDEFFNKMLASLDELKEYLNDCDQDIDKYIDLMYYNRGISYLKANDRIQFNAKYVEHFMIVKPVNMKNRLLYIVHKLFGSMIISRYFQMIFLTDIPTRLIRKISSALGMDVIYT